MPLSWSSGAKVAAPQCTHTPAREAEGTGGWLHRAGRDGAHETSDIALAWCAGRCGGKGRSAEGLLHVLGTGAPGAVISHVFMGHPPIGALQPVKHRRDLDDSWLLRLETNSIHEAEPICHAPCGGGPLVRWDKEAVAHSTQRSRTRSRGGSQHSLWAPTLRVSLRRPSSPRSSDYAFRP